jgi:hypothetical protein
MIYIEEKDFARQLELISFVAESVDCDICAWLYPESLITEIAGIEITENTSDLVPVTIYENGFSPKRTSLSKASTEVISAFAAAQVNIKKSCDSIALYQNNESSWLVVTIGHEGMCLVQDESKLNSLINAGFNASLEAPSWW